ncbi:MAG: hypothetical protein VXX85_05580, partial [Candidatus Margulisiibacteriota bacterium]|nr:hypothetical protein [Candidatus Margulisiibacteriota bacterium]
TTLLKAMMAIYEKERDQSDAPPVEPSLFKFEPQEITVTDKGTPHTATLKWPQINEDALSIFDQHKSEDRSEFTKEVMKLMTVDDTPQFKDVDGMSIMLTEKSAITALKTSLTDKVAGGDGINLAFAGINLQAYLKQYGLESSHSGVANQQDILLHSLLKESLNPTQQTAPSGDEPGAEEQQYHAIDRSKQDAYQKAGIILSELKEPNKFKFIVKDSVAADLHKVLANDLAVQEVQDGNRVLANDLAVQEGEGEVSSQVHSLIRQGSNVFEAYKTSLPTYIVYSLTRSPHQSRTAELPPRAR